MDGAIDWAGLPLVAEIYGATDIERLVIDLIEIRNFKRDQHG